LRNLSDRPLQLCSVSGVSIMLKSESPSYVWPMRLHGITTDTACSGPISLPPFGETEFSESGVVRRDLPGTTTILVGRMSLWCRHDRDCLETTLETTTPLKVSQAPN